MIHPQCLEKYLCSSLFMLTSKQDVCMPKIVALWLDRHRDSGSLNQLNFSQVTSTFMQIRTSLASLSMSHPSRSSGLPDWGGKSCLGVWERQPQLLLFLFSGIQEGRAALPLEALVAQGVFCAFSVAAAPTGTKARRHHRVVYPVGPSPWL